MVVLARVRDLLLRGRCNAHAAYRIGKWFGWIFRRYHAIIRGIVVMVISFHLLILSGCSINRKTRLIIESACQCDCVMMPRCLCC